MIIEFKSHIIQNQETSVINFKAPVKITQSTPFTTFEFADPKTKIMNLIEVSNQKVNIFSGIMSINLELDQYLNVETTINHNTITFITFLTSLSVNQNETQFKYQLLSQAKEVLGQYEINLKVFEE